MFVSILWRSIYEVFRCEVHVGIIIKKQAWRILSDTVGCV